MWRWQDNEILVYLSLVSKNLRLCPFPCSQTLTLEKTQGLKVNRVDAALEEEKENPGKMWFTVDCG